MAKLSKVWTYAAFPLGVALGVLLGAESYQQRIAETEAKLEESVQQDKHHEDLYRYWFKVAQAQDHYGPPEGK